MAEIHRHMAQSLCHSRCCTTTRRRFRGFPVGLKADSILGTLADLSTVKVVSDAPPIRCQQSSSHFPVAWVLSPVVVFMIGKTLRWNGI
jgi:hypothetical protein